MIGESPASVTGDMNCEIGTRRRTVLETGLALVNQGQVTCFSRVTKIPRDLDLIFVSQCISLTESQSFPEVRANDLGRIIATLALPEGDCLSGRLALWNDNYLRLRGWLWWLKGSTK